MSAVVARNVLNEVAVEPIRRKARASSDLSFTSSTSSSRKIAEAEKALLQHKKQLKRREEENRREEARLRKALAEAHRASSNRSQVSISGVDVSIPESPLVAFAPLPHSLQGRQLLLWTVSLKIVRRCLLRRVAK